MGQEQDFTLDPLYLYSFKSVVNSKYGIEIGKVLEY